VTGARPDYVAGAVSEQSSKRLTVAGETWKHRLDEGVVEPSSRGTTTVLRDHLRAGTIDALASADLALDQRRPSFNSFQPTKDV
jgi:hypothetical protein